MALLKQKKISSNGSDPVAKKDSANGTNSLYSRLSNYQSSQNRWIPYTVIGLLLFNLLAQCSVKNEIQSVQRQEKYAFLQKPDGTTERIEQIDSLERSVPNLKKFAYDWEKTCFTWNGQVDGKSDPGVTQRDRKYPTKFYNCAAAISPDYRQTYLAGFFDQYANHPVFQDQLSLSTFVGANNLSDKREVQIYVQPLEPEKIGPGRWQIPVVATREFRKAGEPYAVEKFNQTLTLKAIPPYLTPWHKDETDFGKLLDEWQLQGLQIIKITKLLSAS